jgi:hypothetical protein
MEPARYKSKLINPVTGLPFSNTKRATKVSLKCYQKTTPKSPYLEIIA